MRLPNPWVGVPVMLAAVAGAGVGYFVTTASCAPQSCLLPAIAVAVAVALGAATGVAVVVVLALKSLAEFRDTRDREIVRFVDAPEPADDQHVPAITEADESHVEAIGRFFTRAWAEAGPDAPGWAGATEADIAELAEPEAIRSRLGGPDRRIFIAVRPDGIVGLAGTRRIDDETAELAGIVVLQSMLGTGIGSPLLELTVAALAADGFQRVVVVTEADNTRALRFYTRRGFTHSDDRTEEVAGYDVELAVLERRIGG